MKSSGPTRVRRPKPSRRVRAFVGQFEAAIDGRGKTRAQEVEETTGQGAVLDISADMRAEDQQRSLYENAPIGFFTLDRQGRICELNEMGARLLGFSASWLLGRAFVVFVARQDVRRFLNLLRDSRRTTEPCVMDMDLFVGTATLHVQVSVVTSNDSKGAHQLSVVDLSDITHTETLLRDSLSDWYSLLHNAPDTILTVDNRGRIMFVNKPMWGYSTTALVGTSILEYVPEAEHPTVLRCLSQAFRFNRRSMCDVQGTNAGASEWFNFSFGTPHAEGETASAARKTKGALLSTTLMIREISEHKRKEASLRASGEQFRDFAAHTDAVREEERTRVAREIHDELGQALTALKLDLAWVQGKTARNATVRKKMRSMIADIDDTIERVRRISSELRPSILDDLGLIAAVEWQLGQFRKRTRTRTEFVCTEENLVLSSEAAAAVFRVVQEALTNIMRHAKATKVTVKLDRVSEGVCISIVDNGKGMVRSQETALKSLGIVGMKERIARFGGEFKLFSEPGKGTRLEITIPENQ